MRQKFSSFSYLNKVSGWLVFVLATVVYLITMEDSVSFWDCGEFIAAADKLQVGHPPGAPVFLLLGRFFALFSFGNASLVPVLVNALSALASGFTILFLFWTITWLAARFAGSAEEPAGRQIFPVLAAGFLGSLAYAFSDTFWFSAVEGEVYATSSLFTAVVFWAMSRWEREADTPHASRWIILIAYLMGLSIGVHMLNLLTIPVLVLVFYFKKYSPTTKGVLSALLFSFGLLGILVFALIPWVYRIGSWFDLLFVNSLHLPVNSGLVFYLLLLTGGIIFLIRYSLKKKKIILNYTLTVFTVIMIGFSSYLIILIRSSANPPMDQNNPENAFALVDYLNRKQYEEFPLLSGYYYSAPAIDLKQKKEGYTYQEGKYIPYYGPEYEFDQRFKTVFPRMHTNREEIYEQDYRYWGGVGSQTVSMPNGERVVLPTFGENLQYFFRYQLGFMYLRYFMWNFVGRQNDIQGHGNVIHGNWISGIKAVDEARLGPQDGMPADLRNNPARNTYYFLPLLLGLLGALHHYRKRKQDFWVVLLLFLMTGIAIVVYLNQNPHQPRERDYAYAGSFYAFAIWIGLGFPAVLSFLAKVLRNRLAQGAVFLLLMAAIPGLMISQNWDDHDRSERYTARDFAYNYLIGCSENGILFSYGDNDTFPVWYLQDVEDVRTDVRLINLSYLAAPWYIEQMYHRMYASDPVPFQLKPGQVRDGERTLVEFQQSLKKPYDLAELIAFVGDDDPKTRKRSAYQPGKQVDYFPTRSFVVPVDSVQIQQLGIVGPHEGERLLENLQWDFPGNSVYKNQLMLLDLISGQNWERGPFFTVTTPASAFVGLEKFFREEGFTFRLMPLEDSGLEDRFYGFIGTSEMYENLMHRYRWGNMQDPEVYLDENNRRMIRNFRSMFGRLALALAMEGEEQKALEVLEREAEVIPRDKIAWDYYALELPEAFLQLGKKTKGLEIADLIATATRERLNYLLRLGSENQQMLSMEYSFSIQTLAEMADLLRKNGEAEIANRYMQEANDYYRRFQQMGS